MDAIQGIRLTNQVQQVRRIQQRQPTCCGTAATYQQRDDRTGLRRLQTADGGMFFARSLTNSKPQPQPPLTVPGCPLQPGYLQQRPFS
jgi:hypothetical protein